MNSSDDRNIGETKDVGFQVGARKTFNISLENAWDFIISLDALSIWLGKNSIEQIKEGMNYSLDNGIFGKIRVFSPLSHIRLTWQHPEWKRSSTIQVRVIPKGDKTVIAFHQEHLPGLEEREIRKKFFKNVLQEFDSIFTKNT